MKTVRAYFNETLLVTVTRFTWEEAERIAQQYQYIFGGGDSFRIERVNDNNKQKGN